MRKSKKRKLRIMPILIIGSLFLSIILFANMVNSKSANATSVYNEKPMAKIIVDQGDTLWALAKECRPDYQGDIRALIHEIKEINDLDSSMIISGEIIYIPLD